MTLLQLFTFLFAHPEYTIFFGVIFLSLVWALERIVLRLISTPLQLAKERTKQLTLQLELEKARQQPKQPIYVDHDYEQGYMMEQQQS